MKEFSKLKKACSRYPELVLRVNEKPKIRKRPKGKAKNGFINKFCKWFFTGKGDPIIGSPLKFGKTISFFKRIFLLDSVHHVPKNTH